MYLRERLVSGFVGGLVSHSSRQSVGHLGGPETISEVDVSAGVILASLDVHLLALLVLQCGVLTQPADMFIKKVNETLVLVSIVNYPKPAN